jgi:periplasmic protein TonB
MKSLLRILFTLTLLVGSSRLLVAQDADGIYTKVDEKPVPLKTFAPQYPDSQRAEKTTGIVSVVCIVDESGKVISAIVSKSSHVDFEKPALDAVLKWKFKPALVGGKPVKVRFTIPFHFSVGSES